MSLFIWARTSHCCAGMSMQCGFTGAMDLSKRPLGKISGTFTPAGAREPSAFCGTFRLPFSVVKGNRELPARNVPGYYLADDFTTLIPIQKSELSLGMPTVRLELKDEETQGLLRPDDTEGMNYQYVVMPMRI